MKLPAKHTFRELFEDAKGVLSAFTLVSLFAGFTLVSAPLITRMMGWEKLSREETGSLTLLFLVSALSDALLGIYLNKLPSTLTLDTGGGDATVAAGPSATAASAPETPTTTQPPVNAD